MSSSPVGPGSAYGAAGIDYHALDGGKRRALSAALATSGLLSVRNAAAIDESRGEPAFVFELAGQTLAFVVEGLGTKSMIARLVEDDLGVEGYAHVAYDTVAAIVNDLCCVGALPLVVNAYFATGSSDWYANEERSTALLAGWQRACVDAGATWGGGESPSLPGMVAGPEIELAGSAIGAVPAGRRPILGADLAPGDEIVFVQSSGLHANGASLARKIAGELEEGYRTALPSGRTLGAALLDPSLIYVPLVQALMAGDLGIHYLSHITGHGMLKLMRPRRDLGYRITRLPEVPEVLEFLVHAAGMPPAEAYSTFNMGAGFAVYCAPGEGERVVALAAELDLAAHVAGTVEPGPRRVVLEEVDVVFEDSDLDLAPPPAAPRSATPPPR
ncbi:MAG TPA: AIR synthase-related protein [Solirubrobacteraceae bacterium]|jgi:phosphoribosylformylglycinamidine cyclo-ligase|nr:AIR synthase-related protein [Solirubrobacteraceae bacterium]